MKARTLAHLHEIADRYAIQFVQTDALLSSCEHVGPSDTAGLSLSKRLVAYNDSAYVEYVLHEITHVICQPPQQSLAYMPEDFVLLQFERALARTFRDHDVLSRIIDYQENTVTPLICPGGGWLSEVADYTKGHAWRLGFRRARRLDLLDRRNRPTWRNATWPRDLVLEARDLAIEHGMAEEG